MMHQTAHVIEGISLRVDRDAGAIPATATSGPLVMIRKWPLQELIA